MENTWKINLYLRLKNGGFHQASVYLIYENTSMITQQTCWSNQMETFSALLPIWNSPVNSPHRGQWRRALMFSLICTWINGWVNKGKAGDWRRHRAHYDVIVMFKHVLLEETFNGAWIFAYRSCRVLTMSRCMLKFTNNLKRIYVSVNLEVTGWGKVQCQAIRGPARSVRSQAIVSRYACTLLIGFLVMNACKNLSWNQIDFHEWLYLKGLIVLLYHTVVAYLLVSYAKCHHLLYIAKI